MWNKFFYRTFHLLLWPFKKKSLFKMHFGNKSDMYMMDLSFLVLTRGKWSCRKTLPQQLQRKSYLHTHTLGQCTTQRKLVFQVFITMMDLDWVEMLLQVWGHHVASREGELSERKVNVGYQGWSQCPLSPEPPFLTGLLSGLSVELEDLFT